MSGDRFSRESLDFEFIMRQFTPGSVIHGFKVTRSELIPEINSVVVLLSHERTMLEHMHVFSNDRENVFVIGVRTVAEDSRGAARVLENLVLSGSRCFPCRDILNAMRGRTQATYMGVSRMVDCTFYPVATQNHVDFSNWVNILFDAVYRPNLDEHDFMHEAWHVKIHDAEDRGYHIGGAAYSESIGFLMNTQAYMHQRVMSGLFPSHGYAHAISGLPSEILKLKVDDVRRYHAKYFTPTNSSVFTYGDFPLDETLRQEDALLKICFPGAVQPPPTLDVGDEPDWTESRQEVVKCTPYPGDEELNYGALAIGYALEENFKIYENFCLRVLSTVLLSGPSALIPRAFVDAYVTRGIVSDSGIDTSVHTSYLTIGLQKIQMHQIQTAVDTVAETFLTIAREGISPELIEAALRRMEIRYKNRDSQFGLKLYRQIIGAWNHNPDPVGALKFDALTGRLRSDMESNPRYFSELVEKYFIYNAHKMIVTMQPDPRHSINQGQLLLPVEKMTIAQVTENIVKMEEWEKVVAAPLNTECLPNLNFDHFGTEVVSAPVMTHKFHGVSVSLYPQTTNGLVYFRALVDTSSIPDELKQILPLFCRLLSGVGDAFKEKIYVGAGDLTASPIIAPNPSDPNKIEQGVVFFSYCLVRDAKEMFQLWNKIFEEWEPKDPWKTRSMVQDIIGTFFHNPSAFLQLAWKHSARTLRPAAWASEKLSGFNFFRILTDAEETTDYAALTQKLMMLKPLVLTKARMRCAIHADLSDIENLVHPLKELLDQLPGQPEAETPTIYHEVATDKRAKMKANLLFPLPEYYTSMSLALPAYDNNDYAALLIAAKMVEMKCDAGFVEHAETGVAIQPTGVATFFARNDSDPFATIAALKAEVDQICSGRIDDAELVAAKRSVYHEDNAPVPPNLRGIDNFLLTITDSMKIRQKQNLLGMTKRQVAEAAKRHFAGANAHGICMIGKKLTEMSDAENWEFQYLAST